MSETITQNITEALSYLKEWVPPALYAPSIGIICGSGLNGLEDTVLPEPRYEVSYGEIPNFPESTGKNMRANQRKVTLRNSLGVVPGHAGKLVFGLFKSGGKPLVLMLGRIQSVFIQLSLS